MGSQTSPPAAVWPPMERHWLLRCSSGVCYVRRAGACMFPRGGFVARDGRFPWQEYGDWKPEGLYGRHPAQLPVHMGPVALHLMIRDIGSLRGG